MSETSKSIDRKYVSGCEGVVVNRMMGSVYRWVPGFFWG